MTSENGRWVIGYRPFAKPSPAFVVWRHRVDSESMLHCDHLQDAATGKDALFSSRADAVRAVRSIQHLAKG